jgi:hypothetical protein
MGINGEEAKAKILSLTVLHYPVSTACLNLSVSSIASVPTQTALRPRVWRRIDP